MASCPSPQRTPCSQRSLPVQGMLVPIPSARQPKKAVLVLGEPSQHVAKALGSHDAVDDLTQEVGMAVVTGVFFNHMHQHPTHRWASGTRCIAP